MAVYKLELREVLIRHVLVEADSMSEAEEIVKNAADDGTIKFRDDDDFDKYNVTFNKIYLNGIDENIKKNYTDYVNDYITKDGERLEEAENGNQND